MAGAWLLKIKTKKYTKTLLESCAWTTFFFKRFAWGPSQNQQMMILLENYVIPLIIFVGTFQANQDLTKNTKIIMWKCMDHVFFEPTWCLLMKMKITKWHNKKKLLESCAWTMFFLNRFVWGPSENQQMMILLENFVTPPIIFNGTFQVNQKLTKMRKSWCESAWTMIFWTGLYGDLHKIANIEFPLEKLWPLLLLCILNFKCFKKMQKHTKSNVWKRLGHDFLNRFVWGPSQNQQILILLENFVTPPITFNTKFHFLTNCQKWSKIMIFKNHDFFAPLWSPHFIFFFFLFYK